ncbi:CAF17-like 4Fe-4S cluster assembly/insertion protein YgfZ [Methylophaga sp.]|uniref:CAF17-like 4Fe-4S cluster assembly/insertion protein YgfZ n=1 Tax=Methylophaga sp. TaxID=2024840 RepID=UPI003F6A1CAA
MSWQTLIQQQADLATNQSPDSDQASLVPLPDQHIIRVSGDDASSFLQNLLTNDVNALQLNQSQLSGLCNPKGRLLAIFQLVKREQDFLIVLPAELSAAIAQRLTMFKLRSKVEISLSDTLVAAGIINPDQLLTDLPEEAMQGVQTEHGLMMKQQGDVRRYLILSEKKNFSGLSDFLSNGWQLTTQGSWQLLDIKAGMPAIFNLTKEQFTPQQVNLDLVNGVSFKKGCYPGQEVVARLHYLGSPSRRMFLGSIDSDELPQANTAVMNDENTTLGHVVQAQIDDDNSILCQLSMKLSSINHAAKIEGQIVRQFTALADESD